MIRDMQQTLPGLQILLSDQKRTAFGTLGEKWAALELERAGYSVGFAKINQKRGDLRVVNPITGEIIRVEIKTARQGRCGRWQFNLVKNHHTSIKHADVVILLAVLKSGRPVHFIIPVQQISNTKKITIPSHPESYAGRYAVFRRRDWRLA